MGKFRLSGVGPTKKEVGRGTGRGEAILSLSIYWEPLPPNPQRIDVNRQTETAFVKALDRAFGEGHGSHYERIDLPILRAMAAANDEFHQLVDAVETHGRIRIWGET
jgi:hypothetical protein